MRDKLQHTYGKCAPRVRPPKERALVKKSAFLLYNMVVLHPFVNGKKKTSYELVRPFLRLNGFELGPSPTEVYGFLPKIASGKASGADAKRWMATNLTGPGK